MVGGIWEMVAGMGYGKTVLTFLCGSPHLGGFWAVVPFGNCVLWLRCFNVVCRQAIFPGSGQMSYPGAQFWYWVDGKYTFFFTAFLVDYDVSLGANPKAPLGRRNSSVRTENTVQLGCHSSIGLFVWLSVLLIGQCVVRFRKSFGILVVRSSEESPHGVDPQNWTPNLAGWAFLAAAAVRKNGVTFFIV